jgi:hypothetical protein
MLSSCGILTRFWVMASPCGPSPSHTLDTLLSVGLLWMSISPTKGPLPDKIQHTQQTNIHAPGGIRNHYRSRQAVVDLRFRSRGHWGLQVRVCACVCVCECVCVYTEENFSGAVTNLSSCLLHGTESVLSS